MSLFLQVKATFREVALVITADIQDEQRVFQRLQERRSWTVQHLTARQTAYRSKLTGF